jgi:molybdopterin synthase sulfur carrier subunit
VSCTIHLKFFATLGKFAPPDAACYAVTPGTTVRAVLENLGVPLSQAKLVFVDNVVTSVDTPLKGGERIGVFPPVGGG